MGESQERGDDTQTVEIDNFLPKNSVSHVAPFS